MCGPALGVHSGLGMRRGTLGAILDCVETEAVNTGTSMDPKLREFLVESFRAHGVVVTSVASSGSDIIEFEGGQPSISGEFFSNSDTSVQLDLRIHLNGGRTLVESFAGWGETLDHAKVFALRSFSQSVLHVILSAFFGKESQDVNRETWVVDDRHYDAYLGNFDIRTQLIRSPDTPEALFPQLEAKLKKYLSGEAVHWVRLYHGQHDGTAHTNEILVDNESWDDGARWLEQKPWPQDVGYYSIRLFAVFILRMGNN